MSLKYGAFGAAVVSAAAMAHADVYNDATGDTFLSPNDPHMDIASIEITNDASKLYLTLQLAGAIDNPNWGKYGVLMDTRTGGTNDPSNGWFRPIQTTNLNDFWVGSWVDSGGGAQVWEFDGANWFEKTATYSGVQITQDLSQAAAGKVSWAIDLATLGLGVGDIVLFDAVSSGGGGGDPGVDHLSRADLATSDWSVPSASGAYLSYTVVPAPGAATLLGLGGLLAARRRRA